MSGSIVYVVSAGSYSDYSVVCLCSTRKRAEAIAAKLREANAVSEMVIDEIEPPKGKRYGFLFSTTTGDILHIENEDWSGYGPTEDVWDGPAWLAKEQVRILVWGKSKDLATKRATERFQQWRAYRALNQGVAP